jgi:hypothetical protein
MQCLKCQFENPAGIKFCGECGHNLIPVKEISEQKSEAKNLKPRPSAKKSLSMPVMR